jgi:hypothetical protein
MPIPAHALLMAAGVSSSGITDPSDISDLTLWLDASDTATITESGGAVSQWDDKSSDGRDFAQSTAGAKPTTGATTQNGLNVINFDGGDYLTRAAFMFNNSRASGGTLFVVWKQTSGSNSRLVGEGSTSTATPMYNFGLNVTTNEVLSQHRTDGNSISTVLSGLSANDTNWHVGVWTDTGNSTSPIRTFDTKLDGADGTSNTYQSGGTTLTTCAIGALVRTTVGNHLTGSIAEVVYYDRLLDASEISQVETYLTDKWGL